VFDDKPNPFVAGTSNTLTATFASLRDDGSPKDRDRQDFLEFIEIIQDASTGATIRTVTTVKDVPVFPKGAGDSWKETITSFWDGRNSNGEFVKDGTYNYVAFGRVVNDRDDKKKDRTVAEAFPITGQITLQVLAITDFSPKSGPFGTPITVTGSAFVPTAG